MRRSRGGRPDAASGVSVALARATRPVTRTPKRPDWSETPRRGAFGASSRQRGGAPPRPFSRLSGASPISSASPRRCTCAVASRNASGVDVGSRLRITRNGPNARASKATPGERSSIVSSTRAGLSGWSLASSTQTPWPSGWIRVAQGLERQLRIGTRHEAIAVRSPRVPGVEVGGLVPEEHVVGAGALRQPGRRVGPRRLAHVRARRCRATACGRIPSAIWRRGGRQSASPAERRPGSAGDPGHRDDRDRKRCRHEGKREDEMARLEEEPSPELVRSSAAEGTTTTSPASTAAVAAPAGQQHESRKRGEGDRDPRRRASRP